MSGSWTVALLGSRALAGELGKKGTASDITLYNSVRDGHALTVIEPTQFPEKLPPLLYAIAMADESVLAIDALTRDVAEAAATADLYGGPVSIALGSGVGAEELARAFKGSRLEKLPTEPLDVPKLRDRLESTSAPVRDGPTQVRLDHAFPVKGVGAVALGLVRQGTIRAHDKLRLYPTELTVEVRSVQVHDVDVPQASSGERVGLALKGVDADQLSRGQTLAPPGELEVSPTLAVHSVTPCRYYRGRLVAGGQYNVLVGLQFFPARLESVRDGELEFSADRPVAHSPGETVLVTDLSVGAGPRVAAVGRA